MKPLLRRAAALALSASTMIMLAGGLPLAAQDASTTKVDTKAKSAKRSYDPARRVPNFFGQLGLSDAQKESIYKIQGKHMPKIDSLEKQLDELRAEMLKECETVLTAPQKQMLTERRTNASEARTKKASIAPAKPQG
jgi:Spy/CpxP family protein refolding chaperone